MKIRCEVCGIPATHVCSGLDVPAVYFCREHGVEHQQKAECGGFLQELTPRGKIHRMQDDSRF